jgi:hypothetical protein
MTEDIVDQMEAEADELADDEAEAESVRQTLRTAMLCALVQQNYGKVVIRKEFLNKFLSDEPPQVEILLRTLEDGHHELTITDIIDADQAIAAATH